ncbi:hypothetical protein IU448_15285 [Nocardia flavorosea]|uniref:hypothetical protein n=1 Tax=Nocardia flavorosea TaxID=53429 RepID=UPI001894AF74|nr:hypothetical protein [Nocardia flavorosea]MBF6350369.1 hypothetical protein [Nocardia flavorosea]
MKALDSILRTIRTEPIRTVLWPVLGIVVAMLVAQGAITEFTADTVIALIAAVLGIPAAEYARAKVRPLSADRPGE